MSGLTVIEDGGLAALLGSTRAGGRGGRGDEPMARARRADVLLFVRDYLTEVLPIDLLDPVSPAHLRIPAVLDALRRVIGEQVEAGGGGVMRGVATDDDTLLGIYRDSLGWGPAQPYLDDPRIQEVKILGHMIMVQEEGSDFKVVPETFLIAQEPLDRAQLLASKLSVSLDRSKPQATLPLSHGTRMHVTVPPCTPDNTALICIRRGRTYGWMLNDIHRRGGFDDPIRDLLLLLARAKCSFIIAGETGSGKTALLEGIVNSWPGDPHVVTIEDNTLEINVRHKAWTRELVQTSHEPGAFGRAAKEALRQTPTIVAPGETRGDEAGAILTIAVSGHAVITTLHAKSCLAAIQRFADCAAMPGSYVYAGRRDSALEDACDNIEVIIHIAKMGGRRFISEIALTNGSERLPSGSVRPTIIPIARMEVGADGTFGWETQVLAGPDDLIWRDGADRTPRTLSQKLRLLRASGRVRAAPTTQQAVQDALVIANEHLAARRIPQALATVNRAWNDRTDPRLLTAAIAALNDDAATRERAVVEATAIAEQVAMAIRQRRWGVARQHLQSVQADVVMMAAIQPATRWTELETLLTAGEVRDQDVALRAARGHAALDGGTHPSEVITILGTDHTGAVSLETAVASLGVRREAVRRLVDLGEASALALDAVTNRLTDLMSHIDTPGEEECYGNIDNRA